MTATNRKEILNDRLTATYEPMPFSNIDLTLIKVERVAAPNDKAQNTHGLHSSRLTLTTCNVSIDTHHQGSRQANIESPLLPRLAPSRDALASVLASGSFPHTPRAKNRLLSELAKY